MSDYLKSKQANDPVVSHIAAECRNASLIWEKLSPLIGVEKEGVNVTTCCKGRIALYKTKLAVGAKSNIILREKQTFTDIVLD